MLATRYNKADLEKNVEELFYSKDGYNVPNGNIFRDFVNEVAGEMGIASNEIRRIHLTRNTDNMTMQGEGVLLVNPDTVKELSVEALVGMLKHEFQHHKQYKTVLGTTESPSLRGWAVIAFGTINRNWGASLAQFFLGDQLQRECEADFAGGQEFITLAAEASAKHPELKDESSALQSGHQQIDKRVQMVAESLYLSRIIGEPIKVEHVNVDSNCNFVVADAKIASRLSDDDFKEAVSQASAIIERTKGGIAHNQSALPPEENKRSKRGAAPQI